MSDAVSKLSRLESVSEPKSISALSSSYQSINYVRAPHVIQSELPQHVLETLRHSLGTCTSPNPYANSHCHQYAD